MNIKSFKTHKIAPSDDLFSILDKYLPKKIPQKSIVVVTSKIVALCEGSVFIADLTLKDKLIESQADLYLPRKFSKYNFFLTIKNNTLLPSAGIDESNTNGFYVLWPKNPQESANKIRAFLSKKYKNTTFGVLITDSKTSPLRIGTTGISVAHSGFRGVNDLIGKPDIYGRKLKVTKVNVSDSLAASAVMVMGESDEQTPISLITDVPNVVFKKGNPSKKEIDDVNIAIEDDLYAPLLTKVKWLKNK